MSVEQTAEVLSVGVAEMVGAAEEGESGSEQVVLERGGPLLGGTALQFPPYQGESFGEPPSNVEAVEDVASVGQVLGDGRLISLPGIRRLGLHRFQRGLNSFPRISPPQRTYSRRAF